MQRPKRVDVLFVSTELAVGGAEHQVEELAVRLASRGWAVAIVSLKTPRRAPDRLEAAGIWTEHLGLDRAMRLPSAFVGLRRLVGRLRPGVVHSHMIHANLLARLARIWSGSKRPLISTSHSDGEEGKARLVAMRLTDRLSTVTTHVSRTVLDRYVDAGVVSRERAMWVPNGVDLDRFRRSEPARNRVREELGLDADTFTWLAVGTLRALKRHDLLLRAFEGLGGEPCLVVAGDGDERPRLEALVAASPAGGRISLLGLRDDPEALMSAADGSVLCSDSEALPLVLAEAAGCELPVVATDVGGCREMIVDGVSGQLVDAGDPAALTLAMASVMHRSGGDRAAMGRAGRELMLERFEIDDVVDRWENLYGSLGVARPTNGPTDTR
ncbi:MAG: glycosyltransferase [Actinomycetota bacterium]|nr:glycosyltransferase [Actinomycetota bacterium]